MLFALQLGHQFHTIKSYLLERAFQRVEDINIYKRMNKFGRWRYFRHGFINNFFLQAYWFGSDTSRTNSGLFLTEQVHPKGDMAQTRKDLELYF